MLRSWRWIAVFAAVAVLLCAPAIVPLLRPAAASRLSAAALLGRVQSSAAHPYSGYAESTGGLALPVTSQFTSVADLFGSPTDMRVWWQGSADWRVDTITLSGETDVHQIGNLQTDWNYESNTATETYEPTTPAVRLPIDADLLPTTLAQRLLSEATPAEVSRIGDRRIAGHQAVGLRLRPNDAVSTIDRVDFWIDPGTGLALRVDVYGGATRVVSTQFLDFSTSTPSTATVDFSPPSTAKVRTQTDPDLAALINRQASGTPAASLAGFARNASLPAIGSIGVYGQGVTEFAAIKVPFDTAKSLSRQLTKAGVTSSLMGIVQGQSTSIGPLSLVLTSILINPKSGSYRPFAWLLVGTVKVTALQAAVEQLVNGG